MRGAGDDVAVVERVSVHLGRDQSSHVSHVGQQDGVVLLADFFESSVVQRARIRGESYWTRKGRIHMRLPRQNSTNDTQFKTTLT